jgi:hypothetical protein
MARVLDARLDVYWPHTDGGPDLTVPAGQILSVRREDSYQADRGEGEIVIDNGDFDDEPFYNQAAGDNERVNEIDIGHKIEFRALTEHNDAATELDDEEARRWTTLVTNLTASLDGTTGHELDLGVEDFVSARLARQTLATAYRDRATATTADDTGIVNSILSRVSGIDDGGVAAVDTSLTIAWNYENMLEGLRTIAQRSGSIMASDDTSLVWTSIADLSPDATIGPYDFDLPIEMTANDDDYANVEYVTGGEGDRVQIEDTATDDFQNLASRAIGGPIDLVTQQISQVDVYMDAINSVHGIRCRIQKWNSATGTVVAADDRERDAGSDTVDADSKPNTGWVSFNLDIGGGDLINNEIGIIVEQVEEGVIPDGQEDEVRGIDSDDDDLLETVAHRIYRPFPVIGIAEDRSGQTDHRLQETRIRTNSLSSDDATTIAKSQLDRMNTMPKQVSLNADCAALHQAQPGDVFTLNNDAIRATGDYVTTTVEQRYDAVQLDTTVKTINVTSL